MGKIISFANQKGGSGKTTLSANLAVLWANSDYRVAVIDADSQQSLTYWLEARKKYYGEEPTGIDQYVVDIRNLSEEVKKMIQIDMLKSFIRADTEIIENKHSGKYISNLNFDVNQITRMLAAAFLSIFNGIE